MPVKAYVKSKQVHLFFEERGNSDKNAVVFKPGASLAGFLRIDTDETETLYNALIAKALDFKTGRLSKEQEEQLFAEADKIDKKCPYLRYYTDILIGVLISVLTGKLYDMSAVFSRLPRTNELYEQYNQRLEEDSERADEILSPFYSQKYLESRPKQQKIMMLRSINNILYIKEAILLDIADKKEFVSRAAELLSCAEGALSKQQRLILLDVSDKYGSPLFSNREFTVKYTLFSNGTPVSADTELTEEYVSENRVEVLELYTVDWVDDLLCFELLKAVQYDILIKKCENCGRFFVPEGRADTMYCDGLFENGDKTCAEIGAIKKYKDKSASNPAYDAFNKAYKRYNSRVRNGKMTKKEFSDWLAGAKIKRTECIEGKISAEEFSNWLGNKP